ncbi:Lrp/AsnC family transcriptional regulator [Candidatus Woesearchaeota archaeon]|nr:Lrp/AsnC family transcriptional regulator [Candidatus Woesearchaeota archaeon]
MSDFGRFKDTEQKKLKIDVKDRKIISLLAHNSRTPLSQIAKKVALSRDAISYRIKRLQKEGVIQGFVPIINLDHFGYSTYHIFLLIDELSEEKQKSLITELKNIPHVTSVIEYSDRWDLEIAVIARSVQEFDEVLMDITTKYPELILEKAKLEVIKHYSSLHLPSEFHQEKQEYCPNKTEDIKLDEKDLKILNHLSKDALKSTYAIAEDVGINADTIAYRIKKMQKAGVIQGFTTIIDLAKLGYQWFTFGIGVKKFDNKLDSKLRQFVKTHPRIVRAVKTLGEWDFLLYITADSNKKYHETIKQIKREFSDIIKNYDSWVAFTEHKYSVFPTVLLK